MPKIRGYHIDTKLGKGAMADVYLATQESLNRQVAIKVLHESLESGFTERFIQEAHLVAAISHPSIITIFDIGKCPSGQHYIAMEYLEGGELDASSGLFDERDSLNLVMQLARALQVVHDKGIVHRDLKPANILFRSKNEAVLCDFGVAKGLIDDKNLTQTGITVGTPTYISPEQALGKDYDHRCDLYSLGVILFELLTGRNPFRDDSATQTLINHVQMPLPQLPGELSHWQAIIDRLLAKKREDRFENARELCVALTTLSERFLAHDKSGSESSFSGKSSNGLMTKAKRLSLASLVLLFSGFSLASAALVFYLYYYSPEKKEIRRLLSQAELALTQERVFEPLDNNATQFYLQVLQLDADNTIASEGIEDIVQYHLSEAKSYVEGGRYKVAFKHIREGLELDPTNEALLNLRSENSKNSNVFRRFLNRTKDRIIN